jgi:hypothetical protein
LVPARFIKFAPAVDSKQTICGLCQKRCFRFYFNFDFQKIKLKSGCKLISSAGNARQGTGKMFQVTHTHAISRLTKKPRLPKLADCPYVSFKDRPSAFEDVFKWLNYSLKF